MPRSTRAVARFEPKIEWHKFGGCDCLVLTPKVQTQDEVVLYFFGGGYVSGAPQLDLALTASLADKTGMRIVMPDYPLAPEYGPPAAAVTAMDVYGYLTGCEDLQPSIIAGESAGGGLALALTHRLIRERQYLPKGICLFSPWTDLTSIRHLAVDDPSMSVQMLNFFTRTFAPELATRSLVDVSPGLADFGDGFPPCFISSGTQDSFLPDLVHLEQKMRTSGVEIVLRIWPGLWHVFEMYDEIPEAELSLLEAAGFINNCVDDAG